MIRPLPLAPRAALVMLALHGGSGALHAQEAARWSPDPTPTEATLTLAGLLDTVARQNPRLRATQASAAAHLLEALQNAGVTRFWVSHVHSVGAGVESSGRMAGPATGATAWSS